MIKQIDVIENHGIRLQYADFAWGPCGGTAFWGQLTHAVVEPNSRGLHLQLPTFGIVERRYLGRKKPGSMAELEVDEVDDALVMLTQRGLGYLPLERSFHHRVLDPEDYPTWIRHPAFGWVYFKSYPWVYVSGSGWWYAIYHGLINLPTEPDNLLNDRPDDDFRWYSPERPDTYYFYPRAAAEDLTLYWGDTAYWVWSAQDGWYWLRMNFAPWAWHIESGTWRPIADLE